MSTLPYIPDTLPLAGLDYGQLIGLVGEANAALARYDGMLQGVVNPAILLSPLTTQEAVRRTGMTRQSLLSLLRQLKSAGILVPLREASGRRPAILAFPELLNLAEGREVW